MFRRRAAAAQQRAAGTPSRCGLENSFGATSSGLRAPVCRINHLQRQLGRLNVRKAGPHSNDKNVPSRRLFGGAARATSSTPATKDGDHHQRQQQQEHLQEGAMKGHAVTAADFVGVMRALLWLSPPPRRVASAAAYEAAAEVTGTVRLAELGATETPKVVAAIVKQAEESDSSQVLGARNQARRWEPRTSLDLSGHSFGKVLQAGIDRSKCRQREAAKFEPGDSETASDTTLVAQEQDQQGGPEEPKSVVSTEKSSGSSCTLSGEMTNTMATADHAAPEGQANIPRGDKSSWWKDHHGEGRGAPSEVGGSGWLPPTLRGCSSTSTLPLSPSPSVGGGPNGADVATAGATKGRPELPPLVPGTRSRNHIKNTPTATSRKRCVRRRQRQQHQQYQQQY